MKQRQALEYFVKALRFCFAIYYVVTLSFRICFIGELNIFKDDYLAVFFDYFVDLFFVCDFLISLINLPRIIQPLNTLQSGNGGTNGGPQVPRLRYRRTLQSFISRSIPNGEKLSRWTRVLNIGDLLLEICSFLPFELFAYASGIKSFQAYRLFRLIRLRHYFEYWERLCDVLHDLRIASTRPMQRFWILTITIAVVAHVFACLFYQIAIDTMKKGNPKTWLSATNVNLATVNGEGSIQEHHTLNYRYLLAMYWSVQTLNTVGFGDLVPRSLPETYFCILFFYISAFLIYYTIANLMTIIMNADSARTSTLLSKARFAQYSIYRDLPEDICTRVENFYDYKYETLKGVNEQMILSQLPPNIAQQVYQVVIRDLLSNISTFSDLNKGMLNALSESVEVYFFSPDDVIIGQNSLVGGAYVISRGEVGLVSPSGEVLQLFRARQHFGLLALNSSYTTTNSYHSRSFSEVFFLRGSVYRHICHLYLRALEIEDLNKRRLTMINTDADAAGDLSNQLKRSNNQRQEKPEVSSASRAPPLSRLRGSQAIRWSARDLVTDRVIQRRKSNFSVFPKLMKSFMQPLSLPRRIWDCVVFGGMVFYSLSLGLLLSASLRQSFYHDMWGLLVASYVFDIIFAVNALLHWKYFNFFRDGIVISNQKEISKHFWEENHPLIVFLSILPIDMAVAAATSYKLLPTFRLLKLLHTRKFFPYFEHFLDFFYDKTRIIISFEASRFLSLYYFLYLLCHWAGCFWIITAELSVKYFNYPTNWIIKDRVAGKVRVDPTSMYAVTYNRAIYWAASVMSSIGFPDISVTNPVEIVTIILVMFIGYLLFNTVLGALANLMSSFNRSKREFNAKVQKMRGLMKYTNISPEIEGRVLRYYEYIWSRFSGMNEAEILHDLPSSLRTEVVNHIMRPLVANISFFQFLSEPMEHMLMGLFEPRIALDGDALVCYGDIGKEMFVIERGKILVTNEDRSITYATLGAGDYFGESCLLEMSPRTASAYAVGYVDTYYLTNDSFFQVAEKFPKEYLTIVEAIKEVIVEKKRKNDAVKAVKDETVAAVELVPPSPTETTAKSKNDGGTLLPVLSCCQHIINVVFAPWSLCYSFFKKENDKILSSSTEGGEDHTFIHPDSHIKTIWDLLICLTLGYYAVIIPFRIALHITNDLYGVDYLFDFLNIVDAYLYAQRFALYRAGHILTKPRDIWSIYIRERLWIDLMAFLPYDLIILLFVGRASSGYIYFIRALLRIPKVFKVAIFHRYYHQVEKMVTYLKVNYVVFKFLELTLLILVIAHWVACGWYLFAMHQHEKGCRGKVSSSPLMCKFVGTWVEQQYASLKLPASGGDQWTRFVRAVNFAIPTLTSETMGDMVAMNEKESLYAFLVIFCGLSINGAVIGSIVGLVSDSNEQTTNMYRKIEQLRQYLMFHHTPETLIHSATSFLEYLITDEGNCNSIQDEMFSQLPHALTVDIDFELKTIPYLRRCPFFDFCSDDILRSLSSKLRLLQYTKGDKIIAYGDMGHEMYFIASGQVDVVSEDGKTVFSTLEEGSFFGETGLFFRSPRTASIVVRSPFCACLQLRKEELDQVMVSADYDGLAVLEAFQSLQQMNFKRNTNVQRNLSLADRMGSKLYKVIKPAMTEETVKIKWMMHLRQTLCPESLFRFYWDAIGLVILVYYIFSIPLFISFFSQEKLSQLTQYVGFEILFNIYWIVDILLKLFLFSYRVDSVNNKLEIDGDSIRQRYFSTFFWYDLIASIPSEMLILIPNIDYLSVLILRTCHLVRCPQLNKYANLLESHLLRRFNLYIGRSFGMMLKAGIVYVILNHWLACVYFMIHRYVERKSMYTYAVMDNIAHYDPIKGEHDICSTTVLKCYGRTIYFVLGTMTSIGYGDISPYTTREILWEQVVAISGAYIAAIFMGYCGSYQVDKDARSDHAFKAKMAAVEQFIAYRQLPTSLKESILMQFNYLWTKTRSLDGVKHTLLMNLSEPNRIDILAHLHRDILESVPALKDACAQLKRRVAAKLIPQIALVDSIVYRAGDIGENMFFVQSGEVHVLLSQDKSTLDAFGLSALRILLNKEEHYGRLYVRGSHFGEFCLLSKSGLRAETVKAKLTSELFYLNKSDLWEIFLYMTPKVRRDFIYQLFTRVSDIRHIDRPLRPPEEDETLFLFDRQQKIGSLYRLACDICEDLGEILDDEEESDDEEEPSPTTDHDGSVNNNNNNNNSKLQNRRVLRETMAQILASDLDSSRRSSRISMIHKPTSHDEGEDEEDYYHNDPDARDGHGQVQKSREIRALLRDDSIQASVAHRETLDRLEQGKTVTFGRAKKRKNTFSAISIMTNNKTVASPPKNKSNASPSVASARRAAAVATLSFDDPESASLASPSSSPFVRSKKSFVASDGHQQQVEQLEDLDDATDDEDADQEDNDLHGEERDDNVGVLTTAHRRSSSGKTTQSSTTTATTNSAVDRSEVRNTLRNAAKNVRFAMLMRKIATNGKQGGDYNSPTTINNSSNAQDTNQTSNNSINVQEQDNDRFIIEQHQNQANAYVAMETSLPTMYSEGAVRPIGHLNQDTSLDTVTEFTTDDTTINNNNDNNINNNTKNNTLKTINTPSPASVSSSSPTTINTTSGAPRRNSVRPLAGNNAAVNSKRRSSIVQNIALLEKYAKEGGDTNDRTSSNQGSPSSAPSPGRKASVIDPSIATNLLELYESRGVLPDYANDRLQMLHNIIQQNEFADVSSANYSTTTVSSEYKNPRTTVAQTRRASLAVLLREQLISQQLESDPTGGATTTTETQEAPGRGNRPLARFQSFHTTLSELNTVSNALSSFATGSPKLSAMQQVEEAQDEDSEVAGFVYSSSDADSESESDHKTSNKKTKRKTSNTKNSSNTNSNNNTKKLSAGKLELQPVSSRESLDSTRSPSVRQHFSASFAARVQSLKKTSSPSPSPVPPEGRQSPK